MKSWSWSILPLLLAGCQLDHGEASSGEIDHTNGPDVVSDTATPIVELGPPIDINALKREPWLETTSGVLGRMDRAEICPYDSTGFFGFYYLMDARGRINPFGKLIIRKNEKHKHWRESDQDEELIQLELTSDRIKVWDRVSVGTGMDSLMAFVGDSFHYRKGTTVIARIGDFRGEFTILQDTIHRIVVRGRCALQ